MILSYLFWNNSWRLGDLFLKTLHNHVFNHYVMCLYLITELCWEECFETKELTENSKPSLLLSCHHVFPMFTLMWQHEIFVNVKQIGWKRQNVKSTVAGAAYLGSLCALIQKINTGRCSEVNCLYESLRCHTMASEILLRVCLRHLGWTCSTLLISEGNG